MTCTHQTHAAGQRGGSGGRSQASGQTDRPASKPNVIVILFDDLGMHDLGYLGAPPT